MSESYSSIMSKYKDMSVSELGSSLLQRKEQVQSEQRKRDRKDRRIQQGLAVLLADRDWETDISLYFDIMLE